MKYIGLNKQIWNNNIKSVLSYLLILFPAVIMGLVWLFAFFIQPPRGIQPSYGKPDVPQVHPMGRRRGSRVVRYCMVLAHQHDREGNRLRSSQQEGKQEDIQSC